MSWKPEVIADSSGSWAGNGLRFASKEEAESYVDDLAGRWTLVRETRVVEVDEPLSHVWLAGKTWSLEAYAQRVVEDDQPDARVQGAYPKFDS